MPAAASEQLEDAEQGLKECKKRERAFGKQRRWGRAREQEAQAGIKRGKRHGSDHSMQAGHLRSVPSPQKHVKQPYDHDEIDASEARTHWGNHPCTQAQHRQHGCRHGQGNIGPPETRLHRVQHQPHHYQHTRQREQVRQAKGHARGTGESMLSVHFKLLINLCRRKRPVCESRP